MKAEEVTVGEGGKTWRGKRHDLYENRAEESRVKYWD